MEHEEVHGQQARLMICLALFKGLIIMTEVRKKWGRTQTSMTFIQWGDLM